MKNLNFLDLLNGITTRWYFLVAGMLAGGLIGLAITPFLPPLYESNAVFAVTIDYTQTGMLSDVEEDQIMRAVGTLIFYDEVIDETLADLKGQGLDLSRDEFYEDAVFEREEFRWAIRYRDADPHIAFQVVDTWEKQADRIIQEGLQHANLAASYQNVLTGLETCLQRMTQSSNTNEECSIDNLDAILAGIEKTSDLITVEKEQSRGLFSGLAVLLAEQAKLPTQPVRHQVNTLVLCGALVGLLTVSLGLVVKTRIELKKTND